MNILNRIYKKSVFCFPFFFFLFVFVLSHTTAFASITFLSGIESKLTEITEEISGGIATAVITLVIVIFGLLSLTGRINKIFGFGICIGALLVAFAGDIATYILS